MKALLSAFACLVLLTAACGGEDFDSGNSGSSAGGAANPDAGALGTGAAASNAQLLPDRLIVTTNLDLEVPDLRRAYAAISTSARDFGGFVAEARINDGEDETSAFLRLRVPSTRHDEIVASIRNQANAKVKREESTAREITAEYTDLQSRLINLRVAEAQYQQLLQRAGAIEEILKVTAQLDKVRGEIEQVEGHIKLLEDQTDYATIAVRLSLPAGGGSTSGLPSPVKVLADSLETSLTVAHAALNLLIVLSVAGLWLIPTALIAVLLRRRFRRQIDGVKAWFG